VTIQECRIHGTLVVICPGKKVQIDKTVLMHPARADFPVLIVHGDAEINFAATTLAEASVGTNLNPAHSPYNGMSDSDSIDSYPSEMVGLVHVTGMVSVSGTPRLRGALICESNVTDAIDMDSSLFQVIYDRSLYSNPPMFYTTSVPMPALAGSIRQVVD
jgi:hypothetical protein